MNLIQQIIFAVAETGDKTGLWQMIKNGFIIFLEWLYDMTAALGVPSYVLAIFLFTLVVRLLTQPLMNKQMRSSRKMQLLQPEIEQIKKRYANNPQKLQQETMKLYKENGASPTAGCLPLLVQMPILWALFDALRAYQPADLSRFSFMWIPNLAESDPTGIVLPLLAAGATFLQQWITTANKTDRTQRMMLIMMPVMFFFFVRNFQALLAFYWIFYSLIGAAIYYPILKKWEKEDRKKIEELRRQKEEEEEQRRAKKAAARAAAKKGRKQPAKPGYAVEEGDFADQPEEEEFADGPDEDDEDGEEDAEQKAEKQFRRYLAEQGIKVKKKKMRLHPYSLEEEEVEICLLPNGKERGIGELRREYKAKQMQQQQMAMLPELPKLGSLFGKGRKKEEAAKAAPADGAQTEGMDAEPAAPGAEQTDRPDDAPTKQE